jgi:hypothetical protein
MGASLNARPRAIGGHPAVIVSAVCRMKAPGNPYADDEGYVPFGKLIDYSAGRSSGCTSWFPANSDRILALVEDEPTTPPQPLPLCRQLSFGQHAQQSVAPALALAPVRKPCGMCRERIVSDATRLGPLSSLNNFGIAFTSQALGGFSTFRCS